MASECAVSDSEHDFTKLTDHEKEIKFNDIVYKSGKIPVFVVFHAEWCGACKNFLPQLKEKYHNKCDDKFYIVYVEHGRSKDLHKLHKIEAFPTTKLFINGVEKAKIVGGDIVQFNNLVNTFALKELILP